MNRYLFIPICLAFLVSLGYGQTNPSPRRDIEPMPGTDDAASFFLKFSAEGSLSRRSGPAVDSMRSAADALTVAAPTSSASYKTPFQTGTGVRAEIEVQANRRFRAGFGLGYNLSRLSETRSHSYVDGSGEAIDERATIQTQLQYLTPGGYIMVHSRYFAVSGGIRWNVFLGGSSTVDNNLPSFVSPNGNNYGVSASTDFPSEVFTDLDGTIVSSDVQNGGYYQHYLNAYLQLRIHPFGEDNRPFLTISYSPTSTNYKSNLNAADYTRVLFPAIDPQALGVSSRMEAITFGLGWSLGGF